MLHRSFIINKIVINIMIIAVMYTAKSQHSFVDPRRRDDTYGLRSLACIQSQSCTMGDLEYLLGNNRRSCWSTLLTKDSSAQLDVSYRIPEGVSKLVGSDQKSARATNWFFSMLIGHGRWIGLLANVWCGNLSEFSEKSTQLGLLL